LTSFSKKKENLEKNEELTEVRKRFFGWPLTLFWVTHLKTQEEPEIRTGDYFLVDHKQ